MLVAADSSALVKLVLVEEGSELARTVWHEAETVVVNRLARVEAASALAAARRARRIGRSGEARAQRELNALWLEVAIRELTAELEREAAELARSHAISGADAIHLAAAAGTSAVLLTWDRRLAAAAVAEGLGVVPRV